MAERRDPTSTERQIIAVARLVKVHGKNDAEVAVLVSDGFQKRGLGTELARRLVEIARVEGCNRVVADLLPENVAMQSVFRHLGFELRHSTREGVTKAVLTLDARPSTVGSAHAYAPLGESL